MVEREKSWRFVGSTYSAVSNVASDGIARIRICGVLSRSGYHELHRWLYAEVLPYAYGAVIDLRSAVVGVDAEALSARHGRRADYLGPIAVVVDSEVEQLFRDWAWERALAGVMRSTFKFDTDAAAWVQAIAVLRMHSPAEIIQAERPRMPATLVDAIDAAVKRLCTTVPRDAAAPLESDFGNADRAA